MMTGQRIRDLRKEKRLSQTELADVVHVSQQTITAWENDKAEPSSSAIAALADYFDVTTDYLLGRDEQNDKGNNIDLSGISKLGTEEKIFSYEGKEIPKKDLELIRRILETGEYDE